MKSRSYFFIAVLFACVLVLFVAVRMGGKSDRLLGKAQASSTTVKAQVSPEKAAVNVPAASGSSRMIVDADSAGGKTPQGGALPETRSSPAAPLKGSVAAKAEATLTIGDKKVTLEPNQIGAFPQQPVRQGQKLTVQMVYPDGSPGDLVVAAVLDGGQFDNSQRVLSLHLDEARRVTFDYKLSQEEGIFRVTLRKGGDVKMVQLWAGAEPPLIGEL